MNIEKRPDICKVVIDDDSDLTTAILAFSHDPRGFHAQSLLWRLFSKNARRFYQDALSLNDALADSRDSTSNFFSNDTEIHESARVVDGHLGSILVGSLYSYADSLRAKLNNPSGSTLTPFECETFGKLMDTLDPVDTQTA